MYIMARQESEDEATARGLNDASKVISGINSILNLGGSILTLMNTVDQTKKDKEFFAQQRYDAGLLTKGEDRKELLIMGKLPVYYAADNIRQILLDNKLPFGWSQPVVVNQGFGMELIAANLRIKAKELFQSQLDQDKRDLAINQLLAAQENERRTRDKIRSRQIIERSIGIFN